MAVSDSSLFFFSAWMLSLSLTSSSVHFLIIFLSISSLSAASIFIFSFNLGRSPWEIIHNAKKAYFQSVIYEIDLFSSELALFMEFISESSVSLINQSLELIVSIFSGLATLG